MNDIWYIPPTDFLPQLTRKDRDALLSYGENKTFKKNEIIFQAGAPGDHIYLLLNGRAKIYQHSANGKEIIMWFCFADEIFGLAEAYRGNRRENNARACCDIEVNCIKQQDFKRFLSTNPDASLQVIELLSCRLRSLSGTLLNIATGDVTSRVFNLLIRLSARYGKRIGDDIHLDIPLTHQEIADMISASRQTVSSILSELKKKGVLRTENRYIRIKLSKLHEYSENFNCFTKDTPMMTNLSQCDVRHVE